MRSPKSPWIPYVRNNPQAHLRLFCLPYAGGGASAYWSWRQEIISEVEVCPVQMPGREHRIKEPPLCMLPLLVDAIFDNIRSHLDLPYAIFGHSMGAVLAFELADRCRQEMDIQPVHLFASGTDAPQLPEVEPLIYKLPDHEFIRELQVINGDLNAQLKHQELMQLLLPALRADFTAIQTYKYNHRPPLDCPITAFGGSEDPYVSLEGLESWSAQTTSRFESKRFKGGHFFLETARTELIEEINDRLRSCLAGV